MKKLVVVGVTVVITAVVGMAQTPSSSPTFEVTSVKPNRSDGLQMSIQAPGDRYTFTNAPLRLILRMAYRVQGFQILGGPEWMASDRFDVVGKAQRAVPVDEKLTMLRSLLADRFKLVVHDETRELPIFALVKARRDGTLGARLRKAGVDCAALATSGRFPEAPRPGARPTCGMTVRPGGFAAGGITMAQLTSALSSAWPSLDRLIVDRTGLDGSFDVDLEWTPDQMPPGPPPPGAPSLPPIDPNGPSIFAALQEQLGLKLESTRGPVEVVVIDHVERPTPD
jgi:uncharacterized protein (TIGR03435 family)